MPRLTAVRELKADGWRRPAGISFAVVEVLNNWTSIDHRA